MSTFTQYLAPILRGRSDPLIKEARDRHRRRRRWALATCIALALTATAIAVNRPSTRTARGTCVPAQCAAATASAMPNACGLLTNHEAASLLGHPIQFRAAEPIPAELPYRSCTWTAVPFSNHTYNNNRFSLSIIEMKPARFAASARAKDVVHVPGIGTAAYRTTGPAYALSVYHHGYSFTLSGSSADQVAGEKRLARQIIPRLP